MRATASAFGFLLLLAMANPATADQPAFVKKAHTYKTVGDLKIQADVYRADDTTVRPVLVWIHGGALVTGNRAGVPKNLLDLCRQEGFALVSIDYRLAPEVKLPDIISDVDDAFRWLREDGPKLLNIDPNRMIVSGGSAGGYLTLMVGTRLKPKPKALVAYWGYGDVDGDWLSKPSEHYRKAVPLISKEEALKGVGVKAITGSEPDFDGKARGRYYHYLRQNGIWTKEVTGFDPVTDKAKLDTYCPVRIVTDKYPSTLMIHGTDDTDVPYERSVEMGKAFHDKLVGYELLTVKGAGHGLSGGDKKLVDDTHATVIEFIRARLKPAK
ncbi:MAG: alpha/beta hydrolase [Planctomycetes bacterium]|nr:alpha/beta hydrolase [Planctomycetota bacterium]